jgi:hypothetical protein
LPEIVLRIEFIVVSVTIHIQHGEDGKESYSAQVWFPSMIRFIFGYSRIIVSWLYVDDSPVKQLTPELENLDTSELEVFKIGIA